MSDKQSNLTDKEMEDLQSIVTDTLASVCAMADKHNIDRDSMLKYFADMLTAFAEVASIQNYDTNRTNADKIRNMSDEELAEWLTNMCDFEKNEEPYKSIYNLDTEKEEEIHDSYGDLLKWLQSEAEIGENMDRYLYKAKRLDNGEWVQGYLFDDGFENGRVFIGGLVIEKYTGTACDDWTISGSCFCEVDKSTICQCTGLKDKNGKLIWEGDIILFQRDNDDCPFPDKDTKKRLGKVFYKDFRTTFAIEMGKSGSGSLNDDLWKYVQNGNRVEVIGNIFDNPELIKEI